MSLNSSSYYGTFCQAQTISTLNVVFSNYRNVGLYTICTCTETNKVPNRKYDQKKTLFLIMFTPDRTDTVQWSLSFIILW